MKLTPTVAVPLVLGLLTWLLIRGMNSDAQQFDQALAALDRFAMLEGEFQRDVLITRSGMLRNYDPLVREVGALDDALARLQATAVVDPAAAAALDRLAQSIERQEEMAEQFKSDNALLQNALAYFGLFSNRLGDAQDGPLAPSVECARGRHAPSDARHLAGCRARGVGQAGSAGSAGARRPGQGGG